MIQIQRILCPTDFSEFSRRALDHALRLAGWYHSTVALLHVRESVPLTAASAAGSGAVASAKITPEARQRILDQMKSLAANGAAPGTEFTFELVEGPVADAIVSQAVYGLADLIVLGTHGRSGFERLVLGSVAEKVLRKAACPVLTVPPATGDVVPASPMFRRILCATDFSDGSRHALDYALSLAQEAHAHVSVLHTIEVPPALEDDTREAMGSGPHSLREYLAAAEHERRARLTDAIPDDVRRAGMADTVLTTGRAYREILRVASERAIDLIVMGIHGRHPADLLFFGSTAQHVVRRAACPVLTLRHG